MIVKLKAFILKLIKDPTGNILVQLFRYMFSGGTAFIVDKSIFTLLRYYLHTDKYTATTAGVVTGLVITYLFSIWWIFDNRKFKHWGFELLCFVLIGCVGLGLMNFFMWLFTDICQFGNDLLANITATVLVTVWNFIAKKKLLF